MAFENAARGANERRAPDMGMRGRAVEIQLDFETTGGMLHRVETALGLARLGIPSLILNGLVPGVLERALFDEQVAGTEVLLS